MEKNRRGMSLIEVIIVIAIICIGVAILALGATLIISSTPQKAGKLSPEQYMTEHVEFLYPEMMDIRVKCLGADSDYDGLVRCTASGMVRLGDDTEVRQIVEAECTGGKTRNRAVAKFSEGCAPIKPTGSYR